MKNEISLSQITEFAKTHDAKQFAKFLDENKLGWTMQDCNIMNYNDGDFYITLDDYDDEYVLFLEGEFQDY